jgi:hypothetical protein
VVLSRGTAGTEKQRPVEPQNLTRADVHAPVHSADECLFQKGGNHAAAVGLSFMYQNFARVHQTVRVTPAMEAGIADHVWSGEKIVSLPN